MAEEYTVDEITERPKMGLKRELIKVYHCELTTAGGISFTLDLTEDESKPEKAAAIFKARAIELDKIKSL